LVPGDPVFEMLANQFMIPREKFDSGDIKIQYYQLLPMSTLNSHKDDGRTVLLTMNLTNIDDTRFWFYQSVGKSAKPIIELKLSKIPYLMNSQQYHGVKNISNSPRIALTLSFFRPYTFHTLEQMYKDRALLKCQQHPDYRFVDGREYWDESNRVR
jgi:hypothetical protein